MFKNNGVLFENDLLQIGVKSEFRHNLGRLGLFYGNKTQVALEVSDIGCILKPKHNWTELSLIGSFLPVISWQNFNPVLNWSPENALKLNVQIKPVEPTLEAGAQIQQMLTAECIDDYAGKMFRPKQNRFIIVALNSFDQLW